MAFCACLRARACAPASGQPPTRMRARHRSRPFACAEHRGARIQARAQHQRTPARRHVGTCPTWGACGCLSEGGRALGSFEGRSASFRTFAAVLRCGLAKGPGGLSARPWEETRGRGSWRRGWCGRTIAFFRGREKNNQSSRTRPGDPAPKRRARPRRGLCLTRTSAAGFPVGWRASRAPWPPAWRRQPGCV